MGNKIKASKVAKTLTTEDVYYDLDFNRKRGNWTLELKRAAISSYNRGWVTANLVLADVRKCLDYIKLNKPTDTHSTKYFEELLRKGFKYVSMDGQHKTEDVLIAFFANDFTYSGLLDDADGKEHNIDNQHFKDLPSRVQDALKDMPVPITIYEEVSAKEVRKIFSVHQKGKSLNDQENRHAANTPLSRYIRLRTDDTVGCFRKLLSNVKMKESIDRELMVKFIMILDRTLDRDLNSADLDKFYVEGEDFYEMWDPNCPYAKRQEEFDRAEEIIDMFSSIIVSLPEKLPGSARKLKIAANKMWALLLGVEYAHDNGLMIADSFKFYQHLSKIHEKLKTQSHAAYAKDRSRAETAQEEPPSDSNYYHKWVTVPHQSQNREKFKDRLTSTMALQHSQLSLTVVADSAAAK